MKKKKVQWVDKIGDLMTTKDPRIFQGKWVNVYREPVRMKIFLAQTTYRIKHSFYLAHAIVELSIIPTRHIKRYVKLEENRAMNEVVRACNYFERNRKWSAKKS